jgi:hypothetical protein
MNAYQTQTETYNPVTTSHLRATKIWKVELVREALNGQVHFTITGEGVTAVQRSGGETSFIVHRPFDNFEVAKITKDNSVYTYGCAGGLTPVYAVTTQRKLSLSNVSSHLFMSPKIRVDLSTLAQQIHGQNYPSDQLFTEITQLLASVEYSWTDGILKFSQDLTNQGDERLSNDPMALVESRFDTIGRTSRPLIVLLSGGYDSRLNLAFALLLRSRHGNDIHLFHEAKNEEEQKIAEAVAAATNLPLVTKPRSHFVPAIRPVFLNETLAEAQSGTYRDNLVRWSLYFDWIRKQIPDGIFIGFGAEAHKGKFYQHVLDPQKDAQRVFQIEPHVVISVLNSLRLPTPQPLAQDNLFRDLIAIARGHREVSGQVDFIHYQTYVANGYGRRGFFCQQQFDFPMPMLDNDFLASVFALPRNEKEGFKLVSDAIRKLAPALDQIPYTSANQKSVERPKTRPLQGLIRAVIRAGGNRVYNFQGRLKREGRTTLTEIEQNFLDSTDPKSAITSALKKALRAPDVELPKIRTEYAMQMLVYLTALEKRYGVEFIEA